MLEFILLNDTGHSMDRLTSLLAQRPWLLADGATGSNLFERGLQSGDAPELWNSDHPERVAQLQRAFVDAGADIILTNSFGGTRQRLKLHKAEDRVGELNEKAARIARAEADRARRLVLVGGRSRPRLRAAARTFCGSKRCPRSRRPKRPSPELALLAWP